MYSLCLIMTEANLWRNGRAKVLRYFIIWLEFQHPKILSMPPKSRRAIAPLACVEQAMMYLG